MLERLESGLMTERSGHLTFPCGMGGGAFDISWVVISVYRERRNVLGEVAQVSVIILGEAKNGNRDEDCPASETVHLKS